jgi:ATP-dependent Clp protease ATP-binding subunit ClpC
MLERFTDPARAVVALAHEEARLMHHAHVGTEHLLVALARAGDEPTGAVLAGYGLTGERARADVVRAVGMGEERGAGERPLTPAARDALEATLREAMRLGHERVEPGHLLLGIVRQPDGVARRILLAAGATPSDVREAIVRRLGERPAPARPAPAPPPPGEALLGQLGQPRADGRLLLAILERRGAVAAWLRERGVDEAAVRAMLGED